MREREKETEDVKTEKPTDIETGPFIRKKNEYEIKPPIQVNHIFK